MNRFLSLALCLAAIGSVSAQKANVDQAAKLSGKTDQLNQARNLIKQAMENPETQMMPALTILQERLSSMHLTMPQKQK